MLVYSHLCIPAAHSGIRLPRFQPLVRYEQWAARCRKHVTALSDGEAVLPQELTCQSPVENARRRVGRVSDRSRLRRLTCALRSIRPESATPRAWSRHATWRKSHVLFAVVVAS